MNEKCKFCHDMSCATRESLIQACYSRYGTRPNAAFVTKKLRELAARRQREKGEERTRGNEEKNGDAIEEDRGTDGKKRKRETGMERDGAEEKEKVSGRQRRLEDKESSGTKEEKKGRDRGSGIANRDRDGVRKREGDTKVNQYNLAAIRHMISTTNVMCAALLREGRCYKRQEGQCTYCHDLNRLTEETFVVAYYNLHHKLPDAMYVERRMRVPPYAAQPAHQEDSHDTY